MLKEKKHQIFGYKMAKFHFCFIQFTVFLFSRTTFTYSALLTILVKMLIILAFSVANSVFYFACFI